MSKLIFCIVILTSIFAVSPSEIVITSNNSSTLPPLTSETTVGEMAANLDKSSASYPSAKLFPSALYTSVKLNPLIEPLR